MIAPLGRTSIAAPAAGVPFTAALVLVAIGISAWSFAPLLFEGHSLYTSDIRHYHVPMLQAWQDAVSHGRLPLWSDHTYFGFPLIADPQLAIFYPGTPLVAWLGPRAGYLVLTLLHLWLAAGGAYLLTRTLGGSRVAGVVGGLVVSHCGFFANEVQHPGLLGILAWMPWWWWATVKTMAAPSRGPVLAIALVVAAMLFAGTLQVLLGGLFLYALLIAGLAARGLKEGKPRETWLGCLAVGSGNLLGLALAAVVVLPAIAHLPLTARALGMTYEFAAMGSLHGNDLAGLALHGFAPAATALDAAESAELDFQTLSFYVGVLTLPLALVGLLSIERRLAVCLGVAMVLLVWLGMGRHGALHPWLFEAWPSVFGGFRGMSRGLGPVSIVLAMAAGLGVDRIVRRSPGGSLFWLGAWVSWFVALCALVASTNEVRDSIRLSLFVGFAGLAVIMVSTLRKVPKLAAVWVALIAIDLVAFGPLRDVLRENPLAEEADPSRDHVPELREIAGESRLLIHGFGPVNLPLRNGVDGVGGYNPLVPISYLDYVYRVNSGRHLPREPITNFVSGLKPQRFGSPLVDAAAIEHVLSNRPDRTRGLAGGDASRVGSLREHGVAHYQNPGALPRAYVAYRTVKVEGLGEVDRALGPGFQPKRATVVEAPGPRLEGIEGIEVIPRESPRPEVRRFAFESRAQGVLVSVDAFYPGWRAVVNGAPAEVHRVNGVFLGVEVPAGPVEVELRFSPGSFRLGAGISIFALVITIALAISLARKRGKAPTPR